uniref:E-selectin n=1 Tax=Tetraodon nigroviridis TaxID=99883 RepID=H3CC19_TETNG
MSSVLCMRTSVECWSYHYSNTTMDWTQARAWCQEHYTDLVAIQNKEEIEHLNNWLPERKGYYWIGIRKINNIWTWVGTNKVLTEEATNWAENEPNNGREGKRQKSRQEDCVEIYIKRSKEPGKWNDESCSKTKTALCYTASCLQNSCSAHAECVETVGNYTCQCHPGFQGPLCEEAIACQPLLDPEQGFQHCFHPHGCLNSSCNFQCILGFRLVGASQLVCQASGHWNNPVSLCQIQECPFLNQTISAGSIICSPPDAPYSYNSTCEVRCDEGYEASGQNHLQCDHTGQWSASVPACTVKKCPPILFPFPGNLTCVDTLEPFSFGSWCSFTCQKGHTLVGEATMTCQASGEWSSSTPRCAVVQCNRLKAPHNAIISCENPLGEHSYGSTCTVECNKGFDLIGTNTTKCSSQGQWSPQLPVCQARKCHPVDLPRGFLSCFNPNGPFTFGSLCTATCERGFALNGTVSIECSSLGLWSADIPQCSAKQCPALGSPAHGSLVCSAPHGEFSFGAQCGSTCEDGFLLNGTAETECTSQGVWSTETPHCLGIGLMPSIARPCPLLAKAPPNGTLTCSHPHSHSSYGSQCEFECDVGFWSKGASAITCNSSGVWSQDPPTCQPLQCEAIRVFSSSLYVNCSHPVEELSFGSQCFFSCKEGFSLNGTQTLTCTSAVFWSDTPPTCR